MNIFGWKGWGRGARPVLARGWVTRWPAEERVPVSYAERVRSAYEVNPLAQRAVKLVAQGMVEAPVEGGSGAAVALVTARSGGQALLETVALHLLLHGRRWR